MEILGRLFMMILLMGLASGAGLICALIVFGLLRNFKTNSRQATIIAALFPPAVMAYLLCFVIASSILSSFIGTPDLLFGDINEPLPNGFKLFALDKMPEAGLIKRDNDPLGQVGWVSNLQTSGPFVLGKYDYKYFPKTEDQSNRNFFLFDTRNGKAQDFATESDLSKAANVPLHLTPTQFFRAPKSLSSRVRDFVMFVIAFIPPIAIGLWLLWHFRKFIHAQKINPEP